MRKLILTLLAVLALVVGGTSPAFAAAPSKTSNTTPFFSSTSEECGAFGSCNLYTFFDETGQEYLCFESFEVADDNEYIVRSGGCSPVDDSAVIVDQGATVQRTPIDLSGEVNATVYVSASDVPTGEKSYTVSGHDVFRSPECSTVSSFRSRVTPVEGTITIEEYGTFDETGVIGTERNHSISRGCDFF